MKERKIELHDQNHTLKFKEGSLSHYSLAPNFILKHNNLFLQIFDIINNKSRKKKQEYYLLKVFLNENLFVSYVVLL